MHLLRAGLVTLIFVMLALPTGARSDERLSKAQLLGLFPGTYTGVTKKGLKVRIQGWRDGRLRGIADAKFDHGRWFVEGNRFCIKWNFWLSGKKRCGYVLRDGPWYIAVKSNGKTRMRFRR